MTGRALRSSSVGALAALLLVASPAAVRADTPAASADDAALKAAADEDFSVGMQLYEKGEIDSACSRFTKSYAEVAAPGTLYNLSLCRERQGKLDEAYRGFDELARKAHDAGLKEKEATIRARADALIPSLARVQLDRRPDATSPVTGIDVDSAVLPADAWRAPVYVLPGTHVVVVRHADGTSMSFTTRALAAKDEQRFVVDAQPVGNGAANIAIVHESSGMDGRRAAGLVVGGAGLALMVAGGVFGVLTITTKHAAQSDCNRGSDGYCATASGASNATDNLSSAKRYGALSTIGLAVGGAAVATGVVLYLSGHSKERSATAATLRPMTDGHGAGLSLGASF